MSAPPSVPYLLSDHPEPPAGSPTVVSLFSGIGGSSLGYRLAGLRVLLAVEIDARAAAVYRENLGDHVLVRDVAGVTAAEVLERTGLAEGDLDVLDGSPPCQGFSVSGKRREADPRNRLFEEFVRLLVGLRPRAFVMENVPGLATGRMGGVFREIVSALRGAGYEVGERMIDSRWLGVPQARRRIFFVGARSDLGVPPAFPRPERPLVTVREALRGARVDEGERLWLLERVRAGVGFRHYHRTPRGRSSAPHFTRESGVESGFNAIRAHPDRPSPTILRMVHNPQIHQLMHPDEPRRFATAELARLCSFPDDWRWPRYAEAAAGMGNSVLPLAMEAVARALRSGVLEEVRRAG